MTKLGSYPSHRYSRSWITQRLMNRAPEWTDIRKNHASVGQQVVNSMALDIQDTYQQLSQERYNTFVSTADVSMLDMLYRFDLTPGMSFNHTEDSSGTVKYIPPTVYATISNTEHQITQAENNDINSLAYDCLPSRVEDGAVSYAYDDVVTATSVASLASITPNSLPINGHLYITIRNNTTWSITFRDTIYYPKIYITGTTRKGTSVTEALPLRYNGTFRTVNEWQSVSSVFVSYVDSTATIEIESLPFSADALIDKRNISVPVALGERFQFLKLGTRVFGSTLIAEAYTLSDMDVVRESGVDDRDIQYEIELLDESESNVDLTGHVFKTNSRFMYAVDSDYFYVYDVSLPYADAKDMLGQSSETKIDLYSDRWSYARNELATIKTRNLAVFDPPWRVRWTLLDPDDDEYYMGLDGSLWPTTTDAWIPNLQYEDGKWREQEIEFQLTKTGRYIVSIEASYLNEDTGELTTLTTKYLFFVPSITPETQIELPSTLKSPDGISIDSDGRAWLLKYGSINLLNVYHDYFLVDYERNRVWFKEDYSSVRVIV